MKKAIQETSHRKVMMHEVDQYLSSIIKYSKRFQNLRGYHQLDFVKRTIMLQCLKDSSQLTKCRKVSIAVLTYKLVTYGKLYYSL